MKKKQGETYMREKYFNDAVVGNNKITASFTKTGELIRMFYGYSDYCMHSPAFLLKFDHSLCP